MFYLILFIIMNHKDEYYIEEIPAGKTLPDRICKELFLKLTGLPQIAIKKISYLNGGVHDQFFRSLRESAKYYYVFSRN